METRNPLARGGSRSRRRSSRSRSIIVDVVVVVAEVVFVNFCCSISLSQRVSGGVPFLP